MEVFFPRGHDSARAKVPGLVLFHGGGWQSGGPEQFREACAYFAGRGLVCATVEYRMHDKASRAGLAAGESFKRVCVQDAKRAICWFKRHASEWGVDPERVIIGGGSAGAHISALATMSREWDDEEEEERDDSKVAAYLWFNPAFSPEDRDYPAVDIMAHLEASLPPTLVFFGDRDPWKAGWDEAHAKWKTLGVATIELWVAPGQEHGFFNHEPWRALTLSVADEFLVKQGLLSGGSTLAAPGGGIARLIRG